MSDLVLHNLHEQLGARFTRVNGCEVVDHYGDPLAEHTALGQAAGVLDLSYRSRLCLLGTDRERFLNGQVTNNIKALKVGAGCYAALITAKGKLESDLNICRLANEFLLDFEPGLTSSVTQRFEKYIIADDVQLVDAAPHYGLWSIQGPRSADLVQQLALGVEAPARLLDCASTQHKVLGEIYLLNHPRTGTDGFDLFVPIACLSTAAEHVLAAAGAAGGRPCGWQALEMARIEAGIPRFGLDMDESNLAPEAGIEERAISYSKGCYIGQEVLARIRTYGQVAKALRGLRLSDDLPTLPVKGDKLIKDGKEVGHITSALRSPALKANIALGYVRREVNQPGTELIVRVAGADCAAQIVPLPFQSSTGIAIQ